MLTVDVVAEKNGKTLWVSVKGYPTGTAKTSHSTQAGHWFAHVIFDIIRYREKGESLELAVALPDFPRYRSLAESIRWFTGAANFDYMWVKEDGSVIVGC
ncbi:MAG: hypothetical protein CVU39_27940 [Chloroflexi bacterium HGW-Chloroflexi-10]|nr:MAG: hypothetical protein CVU39_27940 [Chloroflexi bacterium HGW-Chloroflexi-10]